MSLEKQMQEKEHEFSIFYGLLYEKPYTEQTIAEILKKIAEIESLHSSKENTMDCNRKHALRSEKNSDLLELSKNQLIFDKFSKGCNTQIELLVVKIQEIEEAIKLRDVPANNTRSKTRTVSQKPSPPPIAHKPSPFVIANSLFNQIKRRLKLFVKELIEYYTMFCAPDTDFHLAKETITIKGNKITINTSDVRGDGACGFRAILTSFLQKLGINLSFAPFGMEEFILRLKQCMFELVTVLNTNPENREFVNGLLHNRDNGSPKANIAEWFEMVKQNSYYCTDGDIRLIAILFGMLSERDRITQINVLRLRPTEHNPYQSFNSYGTPLVILPSSQEHINIIHTGGHFRSVSNFVGILPQILGIDAEIFLPNNI
jgi:hypothetical protein